MLLTGCQTTMGSGAPDVACGVFAPITWSEQDTRDTVRQVIGHNAAGKAICGWTAPPKRVASKSPATTKKKR